MKKGKDAAEERQLVGDAAQLQAEERMEERQAATVSKSSASAVPSTEGSQGFRKKEQREKKSQPPTPQSPEQEKA